VRLMTNNPENPDPEAETFDRRYGREPMPVDDTVVGSVTRRSTVSDATDHFGR